MLTGCLFFRIVIPWRDLFFLEEATVSIGRMGDTIYIYTYDNLYVFLIRLLLVYDKKTHNTLIDERSSDGQNIHFFYYIKIN